jgi:hypothetical protein
MTAGRKVTRCYGRTSGLALEKEYMESETEMIKLCKRCFTIKNIRGKKEVCKRCETELKKKESEMKTPTVDDINRNYKLAMEGKALDMPLHVLDGKLIRKVYQKRYQQSDKYKAYQKRYQQSDKYKAYQKKYRQSGKHKAYQKKYRQSDKFKACQKRYQQSDKYKAYQKRYYLKNRKRILAKKSKKYHQDKSRRVR